MAALEQVALKRLFQALSRRPFVRDVLTVATGTAAAQAVTMAFTPFVTRLFGPEAYGLQGLFMSVAGLLSVAGAMSYPTAVVLPRSDAEARGLGRLSVLGSLAAGALALAALLAAGEPLLRLLNAEAISRFVLLIPFAMVVLVAGRVQAQWLIRKKAFRLSAQLALVAALLLGVARLAVGLLAPSAVALIVTTLAGTLLGIVATQVAWRRLQARQEAVPEPPAAGVGLWELARRHRDFPLLRTPQDLINTFSQSLPLLYLAASAGPAATGQYSLALAVLGVPTGLVGAAVMSVFYPRINEAIHGGEDARGLIVRATKGLAAAGAVPFLVVALTGPWLFGLAFGARWHTAGTYAQWLAPWVFLQYLNRPAVAAIPALDLQGGLLVYEVFSTGTKVLALWLGFALFRSDVAAVALFSVSGSIAYAWLILWVVRRSGARAAASAGGGPQR